MVDPSHTVFAFSTGDSQGVILLRGDTDWVVVELLIIKFWHCEDVLQQFRDEFDDFAQQMILYYCPIPRLHSVCQPLSERLLSHGSENIPVGRWFDPKRQRRHFLGLHERRTTFFVRRANTFRTVRKTIRSLFAGKSSAPHATSHGDKISRFVWANSLKRAAQARNLASKNTKLTQGNFLIIRNSSNGNFLADWVAESVISLCMLTLWLGSGIYAKFLHCENVLPRFRNKFGEFAHTADDLIF